MKIEFILILKALYTFGNCQRPVFSIGVSHHKHTSLWKFGLNRLSKLRENDERKNTLVGRCRSLWIKPKLDREAGNSLYFFKLYLDLFDYAESGLKRSLLKTKYDMNSGSSLVKTRRCDSAPSWTKTNLVPVGTVGDQQINRWTYLPFFQSSNGTREKTNPLPLTVF